MNAHDRSLAARAAAIAAIALAVAMLVTVATDEGGPWARRVGMLAALAPAAGALGAALTIRLSAARGELRALAALGVDPARAGMGAAAGGALLGAPGLGKSASRSPPPSSAATGPSAAVDRGRGCARAS